mmetsp:Transcript_12404/g.33210  ORF Transcript_12404/g.33210 Transcript_12404/m.33210 type:complete len:96 (-) Transcript_12404:63-350(-)
MLRQMWTRSSACMMRSGSRLGPAMSLSSLVKQQRTMCGVQPTRSFSYLSKLGRGSEKDKDRGGGKRREREGVLSGLEVRELEAKHNIVLHSHTVC